MPWADRVDNARSGELTEVLVRIPPCGSIHHATRKYTSFPAVLRNSVQIAHCGDTRSGVNPVGIGQKPMHGNVIGVPTDQQPPTQDRDHSRPRQR